MTNLDEIKRVCAKRFGVTPAQVDDASCRFKEVVWARHAAIHVACQDLPKAVVARSFGMGPTSVNYALHAFHKNIDENDVFITAYGDIIEELA